jgi:hypothetical protein
MVAAILAAAGCVVIFAGVGPQSWPFVLGWVAASLVVAIAWEILAPALRLALALVLLPACVVLTWEGGLFFVPSAIALVVASVPVRRNAAA